MIWLQILKPPASQAQNQPEIQRSCSVHAWKQISPSKLCHGRRPGGIHRSAAGSHAGLFVFIHFSYLPDTLPSEPVLTVSFPDWHLRLIPPRQFADEITGNDLSMFLICRRQPFQCQRRDKKIKQEEIKWNTTFSVKRQNWWLIYFYFFLNTDARPNKIWYKEGLISLQGTLVEKHWEISFISALSGLPAVKQQQARSASNQHHPAKKSPSGHTRARITHQHLWLDVMILFVIRCELGLMMTEVTVVCF